MGPWKIGTFINRTFNQAIVIPAYAELEFLSATLESINKNSPELLKHTMVVVVVNNAKKSPESVKENNQQTLQKFMEYNYQFSFSMVDASSKGLDLPEKHAGVGLARKIGIDLTLPHLSSSQSLIFCTDADTQVSPDYILKVKQYFDTHNSSAAVVGFSHIKSMDSTINDAIGKYEKFLKITAEKMKNAGSQYGYVAMGSTMVCTAEAYCAVGGMPRKKATEDFYFLQELSKYCGIHNIPEILVYPSPRPISRVYLGTGYRMEQVEKGFEIQSLHYSEDAFSLLGKWLKLGSNAWKTKLSIILQKTKCINPHIEKFLKSEGIEDVWNKIQKNVPSESHFTEQFHRWFDGLKTIRFLKFFSE